MKGITVLTYNGACFLLTQCVTQRVGTVTQMCVCSGIPAQQLIAVQQRTWGIFRFREGFYGKAEEKGESRSQIWLWVLLQLSAVILGHSLALSRPSVFSTVK